jgi:ADP-heptose:LPS heptosyltransferase
MSQQEQELDNIISEANKVVISVPKKKAVLFAQHSSAGDILMTTQCFKGLKEKHKNLSLIYMTQDVYKDIVTNNPYLDGIVSYNPDAFSEYQIVYNPHGDKILPGGWNNLDVTLHSMYPYFCNVKADDIFIDEVNPNIDLPDEYMIVHTTGGDREHRTYNHMDVVIDKVGLPAIQIGGNLDKVCTKATLDLRDKLTWRQTAWIMKRAKVAVVIDSFPAHLAGALHTPVVTLFGPAPARVTQPKGDPAITINIEADKLKYCFLTSNCWGNLKSRGYNGCPSPCINTISPFAVAEEVKKLLGRNL